MGMYFILVLSTLFLNSLAYSILLDSNGWTVRNSNGSINIDATVPGGIYTDLHSQNVLQQDIFYRFNDVTYRWVAYDNWTYAVHFAVDTSVLKAHHKELVFHGIDTFCTVYFNGFKIGETENMFIRYRFNVEDMLRENNYLELRFISPVMKAKQLASKAVHKVPPDCVPSIYNGECHVNFIRKMQASFAWDWGPAFPSVGIWKSVELLVYDTDVIIRDIATSTVPVGNVWNLTVTVYLDVPLQFKSSFRNTCIITLTAKNETFTSSHKVTLEDATRNTTIVSVILIPQDKVDRWWPNGFSNQSLYNLTAYLHPGDERGSKTVKIGFRTIDLVQEPVVSNSDVDEGLTFYFKVNDVPIFAKGTNWIPSNILPEKSYDRLVVKELLEAVRISNMNMIRVWGGGLYESDYFYQLCDEFGIMVWQDMMFACSMYPVDDNFLATVKTEIEQQVRRLQHHPSIVLWAGNNENEAALRGDWYGTAENFTLYKQEYVKLYVNTVRSVVLENDKTRPFLVSSPTNGKKSEEEGFVTLNPYSPLYGDIHNYNYIMDSWSSASYPYTRFCSEYGFQSLPSYETLQNVSEKYDLIWFGSKFIRHRQHLMFGYAYMPLQIFYHFQLPPLHNFEYFIYLSQINQAWAVKSQTEWYRRCRNTLLPSGKGLTMGALYWQLNDVWQAPSWSSIEYGGKWKMMQYYAKKMFAPVLISPVLSSDGYLDVFLISDLLTDLENVTLVINIYRWDSINPLSSMQCSRSLRNASAELALSMTEFELLESAEYCRTIFGRTKKCFYEFQLLDSNGQHLSPDNYIFPSRLSGLINYPTTEINVTVTMTMEATRQHIVTVKTVGGITLFLWLETKGIIGYFSDNGFIQTVPEKILTFTSRYSVSSNVLENSIKVTTLNM